MTASLVHEQYTAPNTLDISIQNAADAHGASLEPARLAHLTSLAENVQRFGKIRNTEFIDPTTGLDVWRPAYSEHFGGTAAKVDFTPILEGEEDFVNGAVKPEPENATIYTKMLIDGMQNYVLLVDAGVVSRPDVVYGDTNPQMAIVAERFGMFSDVARQHRDNPQTAHRIMREMHKMEVYGSFDAVREHAFSDKTQRLERSLSRRLAAQAFVGETALRS